VEEVYGEHKFDVWEIILIILLNLYKELTFPVGVYFMIYFPNRFLLDVTALKESDLLIA